MSNKPDFPLHTAIYMKYQSGCRGQSSHVHVGQNIEEVSLSTGRKTESAQILEIRECPLRCHKDAHTYLPAANRVPFAEPKVLIVTLSGISQAKDPRMRLPKVTATASELIISTGDIAAR